MFFIEAVKRFGGPKLADLVEKAINVGMALPDIAAVVIPHAIDDAIGQLEAEIAKRLNPPA